MSGFLAAKSSASLMNCLKAGLLLLASPPKAVSGSVKMVLVVTGRMPPGSAFSTSRSSSSSERKSRSPGLMYGRRSTPAVRSRSAGATPREAAAVVITCAVSMLWPCSRARRAVS